MMRVLLAHSAKYGFPAQTYQAHISGVLERAIRFAAEVEYYASNKSGELFEVVVKSASVHDLGKLDEQNQEFLRNPNDKRGHLPVNHVDAGTSALKGNNCLYSALMVYAHHRGLPDMQSECLREEAMFRDFVSDVRKHTDKTLEKLISIHNEQFSFCRAAPEFCEKYQKDDFSQMDLSIHNLAKESFPIQSYEPESPYDGDFGVFLRMALSCLADADHTDTAVAYGQAPESEQNPQLQAKERLDALNRYVIALGGDGERNCLRREMYTVCRDARIDGGFATCDSPVGSGKTTAVMAHLLQQAVERKARRIFVVLPYTSIIQQSVKIYRKALVLPGENPEDVIAELHSRADFQDYRTRCLTSLWRAPIIVTTAVAFFETLASNRPSALRRLHELPGSMIFVDEAHNALPLKLLPLAWRWMNTLANEWSCYWVLASGSLVRYWELDRLAGIEMPRPMVAELVNPVLRQRLMTYERDRIVFRYEKRPLSRLELIERIQNSSGPRLLIMNTVQNAAVLASDICKMFGRSCVEHLSTALTPEDRDKIIERIRQRLNDKDDTDWTLVATSCVEAGVDFSFRTGFREISSLLSLLQAAGRVNRHGSYADTEMWSFSLRDDSILTRNTELECSAAVLTSYFQRDIPIVSELSTCSMNDELKRDGSCISEIQMFLEHENAMQFKTVEEEFNVIDSDTVSVVIDSSIAEAISEGKCDWRELQRKSVSIRRCKIESWKLKEISCGIYRWMLKYDDFLGYMSGVLLQ